MGEKVYGLLGRKLGHSWSAPIHAALGCADYRLIELEPEELGAFLAREDIGGLNVTIPYKRDVMAYCDVLDPMAEAIGSVNTLVRRADGKLYGYNTDAAGFCFMAQRAGIGFAGKKTLVLGSGGASRTAAACAKKLGAREVVVISRSGENNYTNLGRHADAERIVNTTPVGMYPNNGAAAVDLTAFPACAGVLDLIYNPRRTALLLQAEELGIPCSDGLPMLVAQAKAAEEHFFDRTIADSENERILAQLRREMTNLVLIGMPGSGKSAVGAALAGHAGKEVDVLPAAVIDALELLAAADGPVHGIGLDAELVFQLVEQVERVLRLAVHLVDKREDRDMAHSADLEQLARLRLDALAAVDDHNGGVRRHERAVGILREILMARRIEDVDAEALVLELHDGGGDGNAALLFDLHPVRDGGAGVFLALDRARLRNGPAVEQEFFRQRGFAGVRVRNDRKRPAAADLFL